MVRHIFIDHIDDGSLPFEGAVIWTEADQPNIWVEPYNLDPSPTLLKLGINAVITKRTSYE